MWLRAKPMRANRGAHFLLHRRAHRFVQIALRAFQIDGAHDRGLRRQFLRDLVLAPTQHERPDAAREQCAPHAVAVLFDRIAPAFREVVLGAEKPGQQEVELRPQLAEMILERRAGQTQPMPRLQAADVARRLGRRVLDVLRLVEDQQVVVVRDERLPDRATAARKSSGSGRARRSARSAPCAAGPCRSSTFRSGAKRRASSRQLWTSVVGTTISAGRSSRPASFSARMCASVCTVLPRPMSSASTPERSCSRRNCIQLRPCC